MNNNSIVVVEGPRGSGKTPVSDLICSLGFVKYDCVFVPPRYGEHPGLINWDTPEQSYAEAVTVANMYNFGVDVAMDRGALSWCIYNCNYDDNLLEGPNTPYKVNDWVGILNNWSCPVVICLDADERLLERNVKETKGKFSWKEGFEWRSNEAYAYREMYKMVPEEMRLYFKVQTYDDDEWLLSILKLVLSRLSKSINSTWRVFGDVSVT